jgi:hypothetical protein
MGAFFEEGPQGLQPRGSYDVKIRYDGNWIKFSALFQQSDVLLAMAARQGQRDFAESYCNAVKKNMREGGKRFGYAPLGDAYAQFKQSKGGGSHLFSWSGALINAVQVMTNSGQTRFMVGIPKGEKRPEYYSGDANRLDIDEYANALEHGYATRGVFVEPRPIFSDTFKRTMGGKEGIRKAIEAAIITKFATKAIRVTKRLR